MAMLAPIMAAAGSAMAAASPYLAVAGLAGAGLSAYGSIQQGKAAEKAAQFEAAQMESRAKEQEAAGQHAALERRRQTELLASRALAVAGASGAGTVDPDVIKIISGLQVEGERGFQTELYNARSGAEQLRSQAGATRYEGAQAKRAGTIRGVSTLLSGAADAAMYFGQPRSRATTQADILRTEQRYGGFQMPPLN